MKKALSILAMAAALSGALLLLAQSPSTPTPLALPQETHLHNARQLTFGGENAEAYFSADDKQLILQHSGGDVPCDQIYTMPAEAPSEGGEPARRLVSTGKGRTTCSYFFPDGERILFSSTHLAGPECPPRPDYSRGYVWPIYSSYDIFTARPDGSDLRRLTTTPGYDAEATIRRDGRRIVFTSTRDDDLEIYTMDANGKHVRRLTHEVGYDGGAFFSPDGTKIVYRAQHPTTPEAVAEYKTLLARGLIRPGNLELWVMDADGSHKRQITSNGAANFGPFWHPDGQRIIFASNMADPKGRDFDLYLIHADGSGLERVTWSPEFDGFPMFNSDGRKLVWASNRHNAHRGETNIFLADWEE
jgi:Tol biopolymer transport system component